MLTNCISIKVGEKSNRSIRTSIRTSLCLSFRVIFPISADARIQTVPSSHLHNGMSSCGGLDCTPAPLCLVVSSVMWLGLHFNVEFILVRAAGNGPFQRREGSHWDATGHNREEGQTLLVEGKRF